MNKYIFHIDLNAFYVRCEELKDPSIMNKPVIIAGHHSRSVVSTASYEARQLGITSGESVFSAIKKCPQVIIVSSPHEYYEEMSEEFISFIRSYTDLIEVASIDECYVDMTEVIKNYPRPLDLAVEIQKNLFSIHSLKCSIGIAENKFLAKMASDMKKPMGITIIRPQEVKNKLWPLPIASMYGVGKKGAIALNNININTIGDLVNISDIELIKPILGVLSHEYIMKGNGIDNSELQLEFENKSFSQSLTFSEDVNDISIIQQAIKDLTEKLSKRLIENDKSGKLIQLSIRYDDFKTVSRSQALAYYIQSASDLFNWSMHLFEQHDTGQAKRLLRINLTNLIDSKNMEAQINLFDINQV